MNNEQNNNEVSTGRVVASGALMLAILLLIYAYAFVQRQNIIKNAEHVINQMSEYVTNNISNEIEYAKSSIKLATLTVSQTMSSPELENPAEVIMPMVDNTPFGGIEFIQADGMNVMNVGEPFDASDRVYYIEGIKGNTGIWNNYHPKTTKDTLVNFYTPLTYDEKIAGVITGYIEAGAQIAPLFENNLYGSDVYGLLVDDNNNVICSSCEGEYVPDLSLDMYMDQIKASPEMRQQICKRIIEGFEGMTSYIESSGEGRLCIRTIPRTNWRYVIIVPSVSFSEIVNINTKSAIYMILLISLIIVIYASYVLIQNTKKREEISRENALLEEKNRNAFDEISEIKDIIASANMGTWKIELVEGKEPRMLVDNTMRELLGLTGRERTPEETYVDWYSNITPDAVPTVLKSVERMEQGFFDENTYLWKHPTKGIRYVRCGGTSREIPGGFILRGYHYDVDDVVREDLAKVVMLQEALNDKNEYYSTLGALGDIFYSMHVVDLVENTVIEFNARNEVKEIVNHKNGATDMMIQVMTAVTSDDYKEEALEFTDLSTIADRMQDKIIITKELVGKHIGWFVASFISMETDDSGRPTKLIYTTRSIDEEKKQEEKLIKKSQTDELTGLLNRRAYEEDVYEHDGTPIEDDFIYISMDANGLKVINDTKGHMAGDELIIGVCRCMRKHLGKYGKLYRVGGDEFVAILHCDKKLLKRVLSDFDEEVASWKGSLIDKMSVSYGWADKEDNPSASIVQLGNIAEKRMYESKAEYYRKNGVDRRGQQDAHKALCELYTKILKINITNDTYQIVNMDMNEQTKEKGFSDKISEWLANFGASGQVHPDDLQEYLRLTNLQYMRDYFASKKTSLHIFYRRKYEDRFKQVMMEIIPTNNYSDDNQSLFLYVKDIDL